MHLWCLFCFVSSSNSWHFPSSTPPFFFFFFLITEYFLRSPWWGRFFCLPLLINTGCDYTQVLGSWTKKGYILLFLQTDRWGLPESPSQLLSLRQFDIHFSFAILVSSYHWFSKILRNWDGTFHCFSFHLQSELYHPFPVSIPNTLC